MRQVLSLILRQKYKPLPLIILILVFVLINSLKAQSTKVVGVSDGDTIKVLLDGKEERVRLWGIDAPEKRQAYGEKSKQHLSKLIFGKTIKLEIVSKDRYQRILGKVYLDNLFINGEQVRQGYAWVYRKYTKDLELIALEEEAKQSKRGLWQDPNPIPPWKFRRKN